MPRILKILIPLLLFVGTIQAQQLKVMISEEKQGKRLMLFAENKTLDTLNVFLTINAEGYRRSSLKPVTRVIPPLSKVLMATLIELADVDSKYTFDLVVNEMEYAIEMDYDESERDIERVIRGQIVLFTAEGCKKCEQLSELLTEKHISFRSFDIYDDRKLYGQFMSFVERRLTSDTKISFPVIWNRDKVIFGFDDIEQILGILIEN